MLMPVAFSRLSGAGIGPPHRLKTASRSAQSTSGTELLPGSEAVSKKDEGSIFPPLVNRLRLPRHVVHQQILPERVRCSEVTLAAAHLSNFLNDLPHPVT